MIPAAGSPVIISSRAVPRLQVQSWGSQLRRGEPGEPRLGLGLAAGVAGRLRHLLPRLPVEGLPLPGEVHQRQRLAGVVHPAAGGERPRLGDQVGGPHLGAQPFGAPLPQARPRQVAGEQRGERRLGGGGIAHEMGQPLEGGRLEVAGREQTAVEGAVEMGGEGGRRWRRRPRTRRAAVEGLLEQGEVAGLGARLLGHREVERARLVEPPVVAQAVRRREVPPQAGEQRALPPLPGGREAGEVAALGVGPLDPLPGRGLVGDQGEGVAPVDGDVEPGIEQAAQVVGLAEELGQQAAGDLPLARRQRRPDLQVGGGEEARRLPFGGRQAEGGLERCLPLPVGGEQPRVARLRPVEVGGRPRHQRRLPGGRPAGQLAWRPARAASAIRAAASVASRPAPRSDRARRRAPPGRRAGALRRDRPRG